MNLQARMDLLLPLVPKSIPGRAIHMYESPAKTRPATKFPGAVGCFFQCSHSHTNTGVKIMINNGLRDWKLAAVKVPTADM